MIGPKKRIDDEDARPTPTPEELGAGAGAASDRAITARGPTVDIETAFARGDFAKAHALAETVLGFDPENDDVVRLRDRAGDRLRALYRQTLGEPTRAPRLLVTPAEIVKLALDAKSGFVMSHVDGHTTMEEIVDLMPFSELETLAILAALLEGRILIV